MRLRIISGDFKGRFIDTYVGNSPFRPTQERVRQSVSDCINNKIENAVCADICAGSGAVGFELISRGAASVDFVEKDRMRAQKITESSNALGCHERCRVFNKDTRHFLKIAQPKYDIIYFDPPYDLSDFQSMIFDFILLLTDSGILLYERRYEKNDQPVSNAKNMPFDKKVYGETCIEFYRNTQLCDQQA